MLLVREWAGGVARGSGDDGESVEVSLLLLQGWKRLG